MARGLRSDRFDVLLIVLIVIVLLALFLGLTLAEWFWRDVVCEAVVCR